ncbi:MAG: bifunctional folylpolyglutamate synthase/dihydrofolate synthase [Verrucomicrobia bacterium]|nr:bifunctional folylpolyglutamate synthase/dihydrofolate synthase [Verrucomicrobiota bacterium]
MSYQQIIDRLFARQPRYDRQSVIVSEKLSASCDNPHLLFPSIHIAGTNGKGSVAIKMAKALEFSGLKVGLFTSPHLFSFTERIVINGVPISEEASIYWGKHVLELAEKLAPHASFFDLMTIMAFCYFREEKVDIAVIEAGIGGMYDSTNIIQPALSIITSISEDHIPILGTTLQEIAAEKAGIIKKNVPVVLGPSSQLEPILTAAKHSPLYIAPEVPGFYDKENQSIAQLALELLSVKPELIQKSLSFRPKCRFEEVAPGWIFDVAHNPSGIAKLLEAQDLYYPGEPFSVVVGMSEDKDVKKSLELLGKKAQHLYLVEGSSTRSMKAEQMAAILSVLNLNSYTVVGKRHDLILKAGGRRVVCGSFYIMKQVFDTLRSAGIIL